MLQPTVQNRALEQKKVEQEPIHNKAVKIVCVLGFLKIFLPLTIQGRLCNKSITHRELK